MAINPITPRPPKSSGGLFGKIAGIAGTVGGLAAAPFTGGASIPIGASIGAAGSAIGGVVDPAKSKQAPQVSNLSTAMGNKPEVQLATALDSRKAAEFLPVDQRNQVAPILDQTVAELKRRLGVMA